MLALLANPPAPLALRIDLLAFGTSNRTPSFSELIWKAHQIIANPASHAKEVKVAKRDMLRVIGEKKHSPKIFGSAAPPRFVQNQYRKFQKAHQRRSSLTTERSHETN